MLLTSRTKKSVFYPAVRVSQEAEPYGDFTARARLAAGQEETRQEEEEYASKDAPKAFPNRHFDPSPFLHQGGYLEIDDWSILGMRSFVPPNLSADNPLTINSIVIDVHGASRPFIRSTVPERKLPLESLRTPKVQDSSNTKDIDLAYGVFFGSDSIHNNSAAMAEIPWYDKQGAYLYATIVALTKVTDFLNPHVKANLVTDVDNPDPKHVKYAFRLLDEARKNIKLVVIRADTMVLGYSLNSNIYKWLEQGFTNSKGVKRPGEPLFREIHKLMCALEKKGISVQFWEVDEYEGSDVENMTGQFLDKVAASRKEAEEAIIVKEMMSKVSVRDFAPEPRMFRHHDRTELEHVDPDEYKLSSI